MGHGGHLNPDLRLRRCPDALQRRDIDQVSVLDCDSHDTTTPPHRAAAPGIPGLTISRSVAYKPTWWHPTFASHHTQALTDPRKPPRAPSEAQGIDGEPTPVRLSHLSGTGGSDCAGCVRRTARLSLHLVRIGYRMSYRKDASPCVSALLQGRYASQTSNRTHLFECYTCVASLQNVALKVKVIPRVRVMSSVPPGFPKLSSVLIKPDFWISDIVEPPRC
ncbi:hypothetical protein C8T65DRAFT_700184 [Cerioporus squamosus]|nr:hypothetical protein C8T65DRAFT_700184 [Cerioporus squamosus]